MKKVFWINSVILAGAILLLAPDCKEEEWVIIPENDSSSHPVPVVFNPDLNYGTITDIEGNIYKTVQIGSQTWMAENLRTTRFSDGSPIPLVTSDEEWSALTFTEKAYCWFDNDSSSNARTYGAIYTWPAAMNNACPDGWHLPSDREWTILTDYLGGIDAAVNKLMETGSRHWQNPNAMATNESGFTALPGGHRSFDAVWWDLWEIGFWWSATERDNSSRWYRYIISSTYSTRMYSMWCTNHDGFSVRCLKGEPDRAPTAMTLAATNISSNGATLNGSVKGYGLPTIVSFEYGTSTAYGHELTAEQSPVTCDTITNICAALTGLTDVTYYHYRVRAENSAGTFYGDDIVFAPLCNNAPTVTILGATNISSDGATFHGTVNANGFPTTVTFVLQHKCAKGGLIDVAVQPPVTVTGNSIINVSATISRSGIWIHGGMCSVLRRFRIKASNICGTTYSEYKGFLVP